MGVAGKEMRGQEEQTRICVSVVVPAYNDQDGVNTCLDALCGQAYHFGCMEVIIVDNDSDPALSIKKNYPFRVILKRCDVIGSYAARNAGARIASGEILAFTDADCEPDPDWLMRGVHAVSDGGRRYIVGGEVEVLEPKRTTGVSLYQYAIGFHQKENIENKFFSVTANLFCTTAQFQSIGPFDERLLSGGDREWSWRAAANGVKVVFEPRAIVRTRPRERLSSAARQARRVAAGRYYLRKYRLDHLGSEAVEPHRSLWQSLHWILTHEQFSVAERFKMLHSAMVIKSITVLESLRLRFGLAGRTERR